jgi:beta-mannosidase
MLSVAFTGLALSMLPAWSASKAPDIARTIPIASGWRLAAESKTSGDGAGISSPNCDTSSWIDAIVPGTVLTSMVAAGIYPDPLYGENNRNIPESLNKSAYWYRTAFDVPKDYKNKTIWLNFSGINYMAEVWVNGRHAGSIKGAFARGIFDVTTFVSPGKRSVLAVQILPLVNPGTPHEHTVAAGTGRNGGETAKDGPNFLCTIGWDWIPPIRDRDMGIWQGVTLSATGPATVNDSYIVSDLSPNFDRADMIVQTNISNATDKPLGGVVRVSINNLYAEKQIMLAPSETKTVEFSRGAGDPLSIARPKLWWPNGYGPQNLYKARIDFIPNGQKVSDEKIVTFGIRKIECTRPGADVLTIVVNGVPVFAKGGDWGMDEALKRIPYARLDAMVRMHKLANYTMIRNWVGQSTSDDFYDICDKYGILVWDEFFQPNPSDGPNFDNLPLYFANVREKVQRYRSHPCIALWCGRNEGPPPPEADLEISKLLKELDPARLYQSSSTDGHGVRSGGPYYWRTPRSYYAYNADPKKGEPFKTEIGSVSVPTLEAVRAMMPEKDWYGLNDDWASHDLCKGAQRGDRYPFVMGARLGQATSLEDFVRKAQLMDYESFRAMYEGRFVKLFNPVTGVLTWMSNPAQSSFVWQLYSHDLEPNSALYATKKACEPIHVQLSPVDWHVSVVNNLPSALTGCKVRVSEYNIDGSLQNTKTIPADAAPSSVIDLGEIAWPSTLSEVHFIHLALVDRHNKTISDNLYWRSKQNAPDNFQALDTLPVVRLKIAASEKREGSKRFIHVDIENPTSSFALLAHIQLRKAHSGERVLPVYYSDNYISLLPGETKSIEIEADKSQLTGDSPALALDGWNVDVDQDKSDSAQDSHSIPVFVNPNTLQTHAWEKSESIEP